MDHNELVEALGELSVNDLVSVIGDIYHKNHDSEYKGYWMDAQEDIFDLKQTLNYLLSKYNIPKDELDEACQKAIEYRKMLFDASGGDRNVIFLR